MRTEFELNFLLGPSEDLDRLALLATQDYNLGGAGDWFGSFRGGLYGFHHRVDAVRRHYSEVHAWVPVPRVLSDAEYHLTSILFNMDSAVECFAFALNALGFAVSPADFRDVTDAAALKAISPLDVTGRRRGYARLFPQVQALWVAKQSMLDVIRDCHDVSKHREVVFLGGQGRLDPPHGFYESLGMPEGAHDRTWYVPMGEIILARNAKAPRVAAHPIPRSDQILLEDVADEYCEFVNETVRLARDDAKAHIALPVPEFRT